VGSLTREPGPRSCPTCGRRIGRRFTLGRFGRRSSPARRLFALRHLPHLGPTVGQFGEDIRYLAGIVGWPAAIWKVTRAAALNTLVVLVCLLVLALPQTHLVAKAIVGPILAIQVGRLLFFLRQVRRDANRSRLNERLGLATQRRGPPKAPRSRPPVGLPRAVNLAQIPVGEQPARSDL
jgi:hypothetical protein